MDLYDNEKLIMRMASAPSGTEVSVNGRKFAAIALKDLLQTAALHGDSVELQGESRSVVLPWDEAVWPGIFIYFSRTGVARVYGSSETLISYPGQVKAIRVMHKTVAQRALPVVILLLATAVAAFAFFFFKKNWQRALLLFAFSAFVYWQFELPGKGNTSDNLWYVPTSLSILHQHNLELSEYRDIIQDYDGYGIRMMQGLPYNLFPVGTSIITLPFVAVGEFIYRHVTPAKSQIFLIAAFTARIIAALSVSLLFLVSLRLHQSVKTALILSLMFAFATTQFGIHGGGLWSHNVAVPLLLLTFLCLLSNNARIVSLSAIPLALAYITRPNFSIHIVLISIYVFLFHRKSFLTYALFGIAAAGAFVAFSLHVFHSFLPPYYSADRVIWWNFVEAFAANMISPNRGLLIFTPMFLASFFGMYVAFRDRAEIAFANFFQLLSVMAIAHWATIGLTRNWWAGVTVGPRFFSDILPVWILLLIPAQYGLQQKRAMIRRIVYSIFSIAVIWSFFAQIRTATSQEVARWNRFPVSIGLNPERVWDWRDMQILRTANKRLAVTTALPRVRPNILLITIDTLRADHLGCYGYSRMTSPNIDRLAAKGTRFENAFSAVPLTLPSHATILTGLYPNHHSIRDNAYFPSSGVLFLPELLKQVGYQTAAFVSGAPLLSNFGLTRGFDLYDDDFDGRERKADVTTIRAVEWIRAAKQPFFVWVHYFDPHAEYDPPEPFKTQFQSEPYDGEIAFTDHELQQVLNAVGDQTYVFLMADHGESLGEHGEKTHGVFLYNATLHVPLIVEGPTIRPGVRKDFVTLSDVAPTVLDAANLRGSRRMDGVSLFSKASTRNLFAESLYAARNFGYAPLFAAIGAGGKFIDAPQPEFYDLQQDPAEKKNLFSGSNILQNAIDDYKKTAKSAESKKMSEDQAEKLQSLGYVSGGSHPSNIDPKTKIAAIEKFNDALRFLNTGDSIQAEKSFREISQTEANNSASLQFLGDALAAQGKWNDAAAAFSNSLKLNNDPDVAVQLAKTLQQLGQSDHAESLLKQAIKDFPDDSTVRYQLASFYAEHNRFDEAFVLLNRRDAEDFNQRGILYLMQKNPQQAIEEFGKAIAVKQNVKTYNNLGIALQQSGQINEAENAFGKALQFNPDYEECEANLSFLFIKEGKWQDAEYHLLRVTKRNPKLWQARMALGFAAEKQQQYDRAIQIYEQLLQEAPLQWPGRAQLQSHLQQIQK